MIDQDCQHAQAYQDPHLLESEQQTRATSALAVYSASDDVDASVNNELEAIAWLISE